MQKVAGWSVESARATSKLDEYVEAIRDAERRIQRAEEQSGQKLPIVDSRRNSSPVSMTA
jgi:hypothetical protein